MKWSNQAIIDDIHIRRFVHAAYESAFRAWMYMHSKHGNVMPQSIKASADGCPHIDAKLAWNMWLEHYC